MIVATLIENPTFVSLEVRGHADSAPYGADLVCAAASAIVLGGLNALTDNDENYELHQEKSGYIKLICHRAPSAHDRTVLETIVRQIESLASSHPEAVRLERKKP